MSVSGCTVGYLVGGNCAGERADDDFDGEPVTVYADHEHVWPHLREILQERRRPRCRHRHRTTDARDLCERRLAKRVT